MQNDFNILDRYRRENQYVFLNSGQIPGIQSISFENDFGASPVNYIGVNYVNLAPNQAQEGRIRIDRLIIDGTDHFKPFTGNSGFNLYVLKDQHNPVDNYGFTSGFIVNYSTKCSLGQIPRTEIGVMSFGNLGTIPSGESNDTSGQFINIQTSTESNNIKIPGPGSVSLTLNSDFTTNRLLSYDLNMAIDRRPVYALGSRYPISIQTVYPIDVTANFTFDVANYSGYTIRDFPGSPKTGNLVLNVNNFNDGSLIQNFSFTGMTLVNESYNTDIDGNVSINARYRLLMPR